MVTVSVQGKWLFSAVCVLGSTVLCGDCVVTTIFIGDGDGSLNTSLRILVILSEGLSNSAVTRLVCVIARINMAAHRGVLKGEKKPCSGLEGEGRTPNVGSGLS